MVHKSAKLANYVVFVFSNGARFRVFENFEICLTNSKIPYLNLTCK